MVSRRRQSIAVFIIGEPSRVDEEYACRRRMFLFYDYQEHSESFGGLIDLNGIAQDYDLIIIYHDKDCPTQELIDSYDGQRPVLVIDYTHCYRKPDLPKWCVVADALWIKKPLRKVLIKLKEKEV
jgi:hypothetical protein